MTDTPPPPPGGPQPYPWPGGGPSRHQVLVASLLQCNGSADLYRRSATYKGAIEQLAHMLPAMLTGLAQVARIGDAALAEQAAAAARSPEHTITDEDIRRLLDGAGLGDDDGPPPATP